MEGTFEEARAQVGLETQRQENDLAIGRTTPALFGRYSLGTMMVQARVEAEAGVVRTAAWYTTARPTVSDAPAVAKTLSPSWGKKV